MNFPDDRNENKTESEEKIKNIGWGVLLAAIPIGIIVFIIGYAIAVPIGNSSTIPKRMTHRFIRNTVTR